MNLRKILNKDLVTLDLPGTNKQEIIESLVDLLMKSGKIKDREAVLQAVMDREAKMSTGIQYGIAIPHGKTDVVDELVACVALKKEGIDFNALDKQPSKIFIMTVSPVNRTGPHVQFLAEISQLLKMEDKRNQMLEAGTPEELLSIVCG